jgi:hypothetical protein
VSFWWKCVFFQQFRILAIVDRILLAVVVVGGVGELVEVTDGVGEEKTW